MLTRGYCIGYIIDELTQIAEKAKVRAALNLNDLPIYIETFIKELLNKIFIYNLKNLNDENHNSPGIDLGDEFNKIAFQITIQNTSQKANSMITKVEENIGSYSPKYDKYIMFVLGKKQNSYSINSNGINFDASNNIMDLNDISKKIMDLSIEKLFDLKKFIEENVGKVKIEFELPDEEGNYETSMYNYLEDSAKESFNGLNKLYEDTPIKDDELKVIELKFKYIIMQLKNLPRLTREFFSIVLERSIEHSGKPSLRIDKLKRILNYSEIYTEISLLCENNFLSTNTDIDKNDFEYEFIYVPNEILWDLLEYSRKNKININKYIVELDFSDLG
jgi:hypothetical protein